MGGKTYDPEVLDRLQIIEKTMFRDFIALCEKHDIKYFVIAGTAIGTMRDHDMIPWDDDIDVGMLRRDYEKFLKIAPKELGEKYLVNGPDTPRPYYNLIPNLTALENVELMKDIVDVKIDGQAVLDAVGLNNHANQFPAQLSGGEQQRVSIARAVAKQPTMLLCDEPTGALDSKTGVLILSLLQDMSNNRGTTVVIVTHNAILAEAADKVVRIKNGQIESIVVNEYPNKVSDLEW